MNEIVNKHSLCGRIGATSAYAQFGSHERTCVKIDKKYTDIDRYVHTNVFTRSRSLPGRQASMGYKAYLKTRRPLRMLSPPIKANQRCTPISGLSEAPVAPPPPPRPERQRTVVLRCPASAAGSARGISSGFRADARRGRRVGPSEGSLRRRSMLMRRGGEGGALSVVSPLLPASLSLHLSLPPLSPCHPPYQCSPLQLPLCYALQVSNSKGKKRSSRTRPINCQTNGCARREGPRLTGPPDGAA